MAFPGAQGGGSMGVGGRGGRVYEVTNLNDSGMGSLRACIEASGPRTCVFLTGGTIVANSLHILNPFITIAGQTAPGGGIQITGVNGLSSDLVRIGTHDVTIRYLKVRMQDISGTWPSNFAVNSEPNNVYNVILDHCSTAYASWDSVSIWQSGSTAYNMSMQWNIFAEPCMQQNNSCNIQISGSTPAVSDRMVDIDFHHNYLTGGNHRNPIHRVKSGRMVNNLVYNYSYYALKAGGNKDFINNYIKLGPYVDPPIHEIQGWTTVDVGTTAPLSLYIAGNAANSNKFDPTSDQWAGNLTALAVGEDSSDSFLAVPIPTTYRRTTPLPAVGQPITIDLATNLPDTLTPTVGAWAKLNDTACDGTLIANRDSLDTRYVNELASNTGHSGDIQTPGTLPTLAPGTPCRQSLHDGIADSWKTAHGYSLTDTGLGAKINPATNYTYLEDYINGTGASALDVHPRPGMHRPHHERTASAVWVAWAVILLALCFAGWILFRRSRRTRSL
jgi:hypothetical protein